MAEHIIPFSARFVIRDEKGRFFKSNDPETDLEQGHWSRTEASLYNPDQAEIVLDDNPQAEKVRVS
ncbi:hypothetical protein [Caballeronia sp. TF1N1]|uniref:hypothetical protein n=1 Tax=Caballeronia sp. TF1N1 TaxID=2878153 RepID=UPI001FD55F66|nr:hypothetical protein [Caballeronia sp. TF1N1]